MAEQVVPVVLLAVWAAVWVVECNWNTGVLGNVGAFMVEKKGPSQYGPFFCPAI